MLMAKGYASGWLEWGDRRIEFRDAPFYAEKNWGGGFPTQWFWIQCEHFIDSPTTALTAVGACSSSLLWGKPYHKYTTLSRKHDGKLSPVPTGHVNPSNCYTCAVGA